MPSVIHYRFKSYKEFSTITFEGTRLPLWELKYEIVLQRKMASKDFDLLFFDEETEEQLLDEYAQIPRNSHIIVHRIPAWMSKTGFHLREKRPAEQQTNNTVKKAWKEPPENYICFRCGNKGHFIQHCPTNNDRNFDIVKIRKPSGIPKDFLEKIEGNLEGTSAMLVTDDGFVKAKPQTQEWQTKGKYTGSVSSIPSELKCSECQGLLIRPIKTSCGHYFCEACVQIEDKCQVCSKIITRIVYDREKAQEIEHYSKLY